MKKSFFKIFSIVMLLALPISTNAAYTGPSAAPTAGNTPGAVWLSPSAQQTGNINISGTALISSNETLGGDLIMTTAKAISATLPSGNSTLNISNYGTSATGFTANVVGDLTISGFGALTTGTLRVPTICLSGTCRNSWPSGGSGTIGGTGTANYIPFFAAGTTLGNSSVFMVTGGNIGINNTTAGAKLTVVGGTTDPSTYDDGKGAFVTASTGGPNVGIAEFRHDNLSQGVGIGYASIYATGYNASQNLEVFSRGTAPLTLNVSGGGNVGVGTATVTNKLQVGGGTRAAIGFDNLYGAPTNATVNSNGDKLVFYNGSGQEYRIGLGAAADIWYQSAGTHRFLTGATASSIGNDGLFLGATGNAGIGTTGPAYKLDVNGDIAGNWLRSRGATGWYNDTYAGGWYMTDASWIRTYNSKNTWTGSGLMGSDGGLTVGYGGATPPAGGGIIAGNLGVGTASPSARVDVVAAAGGTAVAGATASAGGYGVSGVNTAGSGGGTGVYGSCSGGNCSGVVGNNSGGGQGVYGNGPTGVYGNGGTYGVVGYTGNWAGAGVRGETNSSGAGVSGYSSSAGGRGVDGVGGMYGVHGESAGYGVYGYSAGGRGVYGDGGTYGVQGSSAYAGMYSWGGSYSFYGGGGEMYNASLIRSGANGAPYFCGGDDACFWDINEGNTVGIRGVGDGTVAGLRLGSTGGALYGRNGRIGIGIGTPATTLSLYSGSEVYTQTWLQQNDSNCGYAATAWTDGNFYLNRWCGGASASAYMTPAGNWVAYSDRDLKTDIETIHYGIDEIMKLKPVTYTRKDDKDHTKLIGFIAQDVKEIMPEFVTGHAISEGGTGLGLNYSGLTTVLASGIQDQQKEIDELKAQNADLLKRLEALEAKVK